MSHLSAMDFDVLVGDLNVKVETMTATITDNRKTAMTRGVPDGFVDGDVSCSGELEVDDKNLTLIMEAARSAGSFRELAAFDVICMGSAGQSKRKIELFGCLFKISDLLNLDQAGGEKTKYKLQFDVTGNEFVRIDGVPYLAERATRDF